MNRMKHASFLSAKEQLRAQGAFKDKADYENRLVDLQKKLLGLQQKIHREGAKIIVVFEGADAAGKGGVIQNLTRYWDPRGYRVHSIGAPNPVEAKQNYLQRFFARFPDEGSIVIFDRSWYGRVLVERVEKLAPKRDWKRAYREINAIEEMLVEDGTFVLKYFLDVSYEEQAKRFKERASDPLKKWKLTDDDGRNRKKWDEYMPAITEMIERTSTKQAPWTVVAADSKWFSRITVLEDLLRRAKRSLK